MAATVTSQERSKHVAKAVQAARRRKRAFTAADVGLTSTQLREAGAVEVGRKQTGGRGRPAILFAWGEGASA